MRHFACRLSIFLSLTLVDWSSGLQKLSVPTKHRRIQHSTSHQASFLHDIPISRRNLIAWSKLIFIGSWAATILPNLCFADDESEKQTNPLENRPYAPVPALVPAVQQRLLLEECLSIATSLIEGGTPPSNVAETEQKLQCLKGLLEPPNNSPLKTPAISFSMRYRNDQLRAKQSSKRLSGIAVRASMNVYTANLQFGESYVLTASPDVKRQMIREDRLPDVRQVITADLDLRDLYRNRIQTLVEDAGAELYRDDAPDFAELISLLEETSSIFQKWFALILPGDIEEAVRLASMEAPGEVQFRQPKFRGKNWWS